MAESQIKPQEFEASLRALLDQFTRARTATLNQFAEAQTERTARLAEAEQRLTAALGAEDPKVLALHSSVAAAGALKTEFATAAERGARLPVPKDYEWMVYGHVTDAAGNPVAGVRVRVFDRDRKYDDLLGDTTTDEFGDFSVVYHARDFTELGEAQPDLYVLVQDASGNLLYSSRDKVRAEAGRVEYFEIVLAPAAPTGPAKRPGRVAAARRPRSKK